MNFKKDAYVKVVGVNGEYRYGYVAQVTESGWHVEICTHDEGDSKVGYDTEWAKSHGEQPVDVVGVLTATERRLLPLIAQGCTSKEIGCQMGLSPATIRSHMRTLRLRLQVENHAQLVVYAQGLRNAVDKLGG